MGWLAGEGKRLVLALYIVYIRALRDPIRVHNHLYIGYIDKLKLLLNVIFEFKAKLLIVYEAALQKKCNPLVMLRTLVRTLHIRVKNYEAIDKH